MTMRIDYNTMEEMRIPGMNHGTGEMTAKMSADESGIYILCRIHANGSIGLHRHETSDDINYVISGTGKAICDGAEERLTAGVCHICRKGSVHSILNTGDEDLVLWTVVVER